MNNDTEEKSIINRKHKQQFSLSQVVEDDDGTHHEIKIGVLSTGDLGVMSGETLHGIMVVRQEK